MKKILDRISLPDQIFQRTHLPIVDMAELNDASIVSSAAADFSPKALETNSNDDINAVHGEGQESLSADRSNEIVFEITVHLPNDPKTVSVTVSSQEAIHDIQQSVIEYPGTFQYSCFHLEHKGKRINDFTLISEVEGITQEPELTLVEDPYSEKEARIHFVRVRELIGAAGDRTDTLHGVLSGLSLHDSVAFQTTEVQKKDCTGQYLADFDFEATGSIFSLLPRVQEPPPKTVKNISLSPWHPPPYHLRQKGHLMYLLLTTNEGEQYQITSHISGFYVNKSSNMKFDPYPRGPPKAFSAHSLLTLLSDISPSFSGSFEKLLEFNNSKEPLSTFQISNTISANPWIVPNPSSPLVTHQSDITRTQESYLISGLENAETLRDWNEEFQSTRELPKENIQDRVFRERLISKLFADFTEAAARGAILVARGEITSLNPTECREAQIFVYNNVFFSFGADGVGTFASEGGDEAARVATGKDMLGVRIVNQLEIDDLYTAGTVIVDYLGKRIVAQSILPGIFKQRDPGENQIDYGAVDGKDTIAADDRFSTVFEKLSKALKVKKHSVWDKDGKKFDLHGSVETKGLLGTDGRKYVLDLYRITPFDILWMEEYGTAVFDPKKASDTNNTTYPHRMTVLRPELSDAFWKSKMRDWVNEEIKKHRSNSNSNSNEESSSKVSENSKEIKSNNQVEPEIISSKTDVSDDPGKIDITDFNFSLNPDAFGGQQPQTDEEKKQLANDEADVRAACEFLRSIVIPELISDLKDGDVGFPMDGQSLSRLLHKRGINIRYIGKIASLSEGRKLESLKILSIQEMISRAFKHVSSKYLKHLPVPLSSSCISHLLNCLLGTDLNPKPIPSFDNSIASVYRDADLGFQNITPESLKTEIELQVAKRFQYSLGDDWTSNIKKLQMLREISLKLGLQLGAKCYAFYPSTTNEKSEVNVSGITEVTKKSGSKKNKRTVSRSRSPITEAPHTFTPDDIVNIVPVIKEASPHSSLAQEALEAGRISILQNQKKLGQELLLESLSLHEQIYGIIHPEVARIYNNLSMLYYQLDEKEGAVELARKAVVVSERTLGVDNAETLLSYLNLGLFSHAAGETTQALTYITHALYLWRIIYGNSHPDSITTLNNAAVMLQHLKCYHSSRLWFEASLRICSSIYGSNSVNAATLLFQLAQALALDNDSKQAVKRMKESYNIFLAILGPEDKNTREAESWLESLTQNAVNIAKHAQAKYVQARRLQAEMQVGVGQATPGREKAGSPLDKRSIDELLKFIEGNDTKNTPKKRDPAGTRKNPKRRVGTSIA
ncbi:Clustered mitochondria protein-like protein [Golovinomyces cichoracearum]|uniref:Clustered mitochondria protein homolog n=1 Tax=Golovinomyces cichoracearum TaxID=62708 RepID=A0A420H8X5_9PEZI|nr:Clustered mitochondria protein-like protein [Golovinomyces cichoracearum]